MAGIGFELKRLFSKKGLIAQLRANVYASLVIAGPMLLGACLLFLVKYIATLAGVEATDQDALIVMITWAMLFSLLLTSTFSFSLARFISDMLYEHTEERILPSMYGAISFCLVIGSIGWGIFLYFSGIPLEYAIPVYLLFCESVVVWIQVSYTNAVKDYRQVMLGFVYAIISALVSSYVLIWVFQLPTIAALLVSVCIGYAVMMLHYTLVLHAYFPMGEGSALKFLQWFGKYPALILVGFFSTLGLFGHIIMMWASPWGRVAIGNFYHAPQHDIPALLAFLSILVTTVNFVTSMEVKFYQRYRVYFGLLNGGGSLYDIEKAYRELVTVLKQELFYLAQVQLFVSILFIVIIGELLPVLGLGFTESMTGLFRVLCLGYGLYAIGNVFMLLLLYFADFKDAMLVSVIFAAANLGGTYYVIQLPETYYGFGFVAAALAMYLVGWVLLSSFIKKLDYHIYCKQPVFVKEKTRPLQRLIDRLDEKLMGRKTEEA